MIVPLHATFYNAFTKKHLHYLYGLVPKNVPFKRTIPRYYGLEHVHFHFQQVDSPEKEYELPERSDEVVGDCSSKGWAESLRFPLVRSPTRWLLWQEPQGDVVDAPASICYE